MPGLYLTPVLGDGTDANPFRPIGLEQPGAGWIDLRPDPTVATGRGLLWLPVHDPDARLIQLASAHSETLTLARRTQFANALGVTFRASRFADMAAEILGSHARTDGSRWRPLAIRHDGVFEIWLGSANGGQPIWSGDQLAGGRGPWVFALMGLGLRPRRAWGRREFLVGVGLAASLLWARRVEAAIFRESWPTNSTDLTTGQDLPWTETLNDSQVVAGKLEPVTTGARDVVQCNTGVTSGDHKVTATITIDTRSATTRNYFVLCRFAAAADTHYRCGYGRNSAPDDERTLDKRVAGAYTNLAGDTTDQGAGATVCVVQADGSSISGTVGATSFGPVTDTAITGNTQGGCDGRWGVTGFAPNLDDWSISDFGVGAGLFGPVPLRTLLGVGQ